MASRAADDLTSALYQQRDVQLARDGSASFLLITDGLILRNPEDPGLLRNGVQIYTAYASAFVIGTDSARAFTLLDRALEYGFELWRIRFGWESVSNMPIDDWHAELQHVSRNDVADLYWTANAWATWITVHPESMVALADLPHVLAALQRVLELDDSFQNGSVHLFFGMYYSIQPAGLGRDLEKSRLHFERAIELAGPHAMLPRVLYARYYGRAAFDEELFTSILDQVTRSPSRCPEPDLNLMNAIARERAAGYLQQKEDLF